MSNAAPPIDDFEVWLQGLLQPTALIELAVLVAIIALAWGMSWGLRRALSMQDEKSSVLFGRRIVDGALFPLLLLVLAYVARALLAKLLPVTVFKVALPVLVSLAVIRVGVKVLQVAFGGQPWVRALERTISWLAWGAMVLWVSGLLPVVLAEMDQITWKIGSSTLSLRTLIEGFITAGAVLILALWVSAAIEARLLRRAVGSDLSLRKAVSNATRALLLFVGLIVGLSAVGIEKQHGRRELHLHAFCERGLRRLAAVEIGQFARAVQIDFADHQPAALGGIAQLRVQFEFDVGIDFKFVATHHRFDPRHFRLGSMRLAGRHQ